MGPLSIWLLCLAPMLVAPGLDNRWIWPTLLAVGLAGLLSVWVSPVGQWPRGFAVLVAVAAVVLILGAMLGADPLTQLFGRAPRYEGLVTLPALAVAAWAGARLLGPRATGKAYRHAVAALSTTSILLAAVALAESIGLRPLESDLARPGSLAGNATDQGILGAVFVAVLGSVTLGTLRRTRLVSWWALAGSAAGLLCVATSGSRAGVLALAVAGLALTVRFVARSHRRMRDGLIAAGVLVAASLVVVAVPLTRDRIFGASTLASQTIADRLYMWDDAWQLFLSSPWTGVGMSGYADAITSYFGDEWFGRADVGAILDSPHNVVLQVLVVGGIPGLVVAAAMTGAIVWLGVRHARSSETARRDLMVGGVVACAAAGAALLTHVTSPVTLVPLAMMTGMLVAIAPREGRRSAGIVAAALAVWLVLVTVSTVADAALHQAGRALDRGELLRSLAAYDFAQALRPWDADVALDAAGSLGGAAERGLAGAADPASVWALSAVARLPDSSHAHFIAGMVATVRGDAQDAAVLLTRAASLSPADPRIQHELGVARLVSGDADGARQALERAVHLAPDSRVSWLALRDACDAIGDAACVGRAEAALREF